MLGICREIVGTVYIFEFPAPFIITYAVQKPIDVWIYANIIGIILFYPFHDLKISLYAPLCGKGKSLETVLA